MRTEILDQWYEDLSQSKYMPMHGALCVDECYCATGVLCQILTDRGVLKKGEGYQPNDGGGIRREYYHPNTPQEKRTTVPPPQVTQYLGEMNKTDVLLIGEMIGRVINANDSADGPMAHVAAAAKLLTYLKKMKGSKYYVEPTPSVAV